MRVKRVVALFFTLFLMFCLLALRLTQLSMPGSSVLQAAAVNGSDNVTITTMRGTIYDSSLRPLVNTLPEYYAVVPATKDAQRVLAGLSSYVSDVRDLEKKLISGMPFVIQVSSPKAGAPGVKIVTVDNRYSDEMATHIIGYVDGDGHGVTGIEQAYDSVLKSYSQTMTASFPVDANGNELKGLTAQINYSGNGDTGGVVLTLDKGIQQAAQRAADKYIKDSGAIIVMDPKTGDILACVSSPGYSPDNVAASLKGQNQPLFNRALAAFNLGSVFKIVMVASALENGYDESFTYTSTGAIYVPGRSTPFRDDDAADIGTMDMSQGFANSCNTYFINLGQKLGGPDVLNMAQDLGLGYSNNLAPGLNSVSGNLPTLTDLKMPAELANLSIGQGKLLVTPVQAARIVSTVVDGGLEPTPRLVKELIDNDKKVTTAYPTAVTGRVFSENTAELLQEFMVKTVNEGTGVEAQPTYGGAGGKTGTAQTGVVENDKTIDQAWFAGFYPAQSPKYVIVALVENGTSGGANAGPVFKYIADYLAPSCGYPKVKQ